MKGRFLVYVGLLITVVTIIVLLSGDGNGHPVVGLAVGIVTMLWGAYISRRKPDDLKPELLRLTPAPDRPRVFPCPNCKETINTSMQLCPFCSSQIDRGAAEEAADLQAKVSEAYSQAMDLAQSVEAANAMFPVLGGLLVSLVGSLQWRLRFGALRSDDPRLAHAKQAVTRSPIAILVWSIGFVCFLGVIGIIIAIILSGH